MSRLIVIAASFVSFAALAGSANAQSALSSCNPATGLGANGQPCVELTPIDPNRIGDTPFGAEGGDQYEALDTSTLGQTYECRQANARDRQVGLGGTLLIEDCGAPAQLANVKPYWGTTGAPTPPPPPPAPVASLPPPPPPPPAALPPAAPVFAPVQAAGLGGSITPLLLGAAGLAAVVGIAIAVDDDDNDSTNSTPGT